MGGLRRERSRSAEAECSPEADWLADSPSSAGQCSSRPGVPRTMMRTGSALRGISGRGVVGARRTNVLGASGRAGAQASAAHCAFGTSAMSTGDARFLSTPVEREWSWRGPMIP